jgi:hypothetical protein
MHVLVYSGAGLAEVAEIPGVSLTVRTGDKYKCT